ARLAHRRGLVALLRRAAHPGPGDPERRGARVEHPAPGGGELALTPPRAAAGAHREARVAHLFPCAAAKLPVLLDVEVAQPRGAALRRADAANAGGPGRGSGGSSGLPGGSHFARSSPRKARWSLAAEPRSA